MKGVENKIVVVEEYLFICNPILLDTFSYDGLNSEQCITDGLSFLTKMKEESTFKGIIILAELKWHINGSAERLQNFYGLS